MMKVLSLLITLMFSLAALAQVSQHELEAGTWEISINEDEQFVGNLELGLVDPLWMMQVESEEQVPGPLAQDKVDPTVIINTAKQMWQLIVKNQPVVNLSIDKASALPKGLESWMQLENWQVPKTQTIHLRYKNPFRITVLDFVFRVLFVYGGSYDGQGEYIARATIVPAHLEVMWGYTFNANVSVPTIVNAGTQESPRAGMELELGYELKTVMKHTSEKYNFYVLGNGDIKSLK